MNLEIIECSAKIKELILNSDEYKSYLINKEILENDLSAIRLSLKKDNLIDLYESNLKFINKNDPKMIKILQDLNSIKEELNKLDSVINYQKSEDELNKIIDYLNKEIFIK